MTDMIDKETEKAVKICIVYSIPFALYILPESDEAVFFADLPDSDETASLEISPDEFDRFDGFVIGMFELSDQFRPIGIRRRMTAAEVISHYKEFPKQPNSINFSYIKSTDKVVYKSQIHTLLKSFSGPYEKTVLSRIASIESTDDPLKVARSYFKDQRNCFRYLYYTFDTGLWFGASPEMLLNYQSSTRQAVSMSVAGTREISDKPWDGKNMTEHQIVTDFIADALGRNSSGKVSVTESTATFGNLEHLCHKVSARLSTPISKLLPQLYPTPALLGWPRQKAYLQILSLENHQRNCYGGFVGLASEGNFLLYVNIRCAFVSYNAFVSVYDVYGGGGITRQSKAEDEWQEAENKMKPLLKCISGLHV